MKASGFQGLGSTLDPFLAASQSWDGSAGRKKETWTHIGACRAMCAHVFLVRRAELAPACEHILNRL